MAYIEFPKGSKGNAERKAFWLSDDGLLLISQWLREGVSLEEIALKHIGVSKTTLWRWTKESEELVETLKTSGDVTNIKVEQALLKRALGYDYVEETCELVEGFMRTTKTVVKHVSPDVKACLSWLYSRRPDRWRSQQEPIDESKKDMETARQIIVAIKEAADGDPNSAQPETD